MLTPNFELDQTENYLIIKIKARFANVNETEIDVNGNQITFYSSPYYLRLHLPGEVEETDTSSGSYDWDSYVFTFKLNKVNPGEHFPDLNLINKFLTPKTINHTIKPSIEVLNESSYCGSSDDEIESDIDCDFLQELPVLEDNTISMKYGFANQTQNPFNSFSDEFFEIIEIKNPDCLNFDERKSLQETKELADFCDDHYLADLMMEPDELQNILSFKPFWLNSTFTLNDSHQNILKSFGNKEYLLSKDDKKSALLSLVDIVYAYCYSVRTNLGEENAESPWLINKLSSTLSWFRNFDTFDEVVVSCIRRSLCYPLYRRWDLSMCVLFDVRKIFENGCICLLTCLLDIYKLFNSSEPRYVLNQLYIKDYCIWIQQIKSTHFDTITKLFDDNKIEKGILQLDLEELEIAALSVDEDMAFLERAENSTSDSIESQLQQLQISSSKTESSLDSDDEEE
ncbi:protein SHQ1 homolog [Sipha flava]|jgi:protein SHQ1|uniref:Protein SHQ1 homolog n=1 Tax=Sipha flava TaxID=143950 RepID=A0A2S2R8H0_9HEMI|nr:protein SHQ1 homolog [Sipha flava]XP_025414882.1 protein SHQ1 homolog [Sipha flava]